MKIYLDVIFIINYIFDFIILTCTSYILKRYIKFKKLLLGAFIGSLSIIFLFTNINSFTLFIIKIIIAFLMCITTFSYKDIKYTFKNFINLYLVSIVLGGFIYLINTELSTKYNGIIFYNNGYSMNIILILILSPIILYIYYKELKELKNKYSKYYKVNIHFKNNKNITLNGYYDTGNNLKDPYKNRLIILVDKDKIKDYIKEELEILIPYRCLNNDELLKCVRINKITINNNTYKNILLGLSNKKFLIDGIDCILNNNMEDLC